MNNVVLGVCILVAGGAAGYTVADPAEELASSRGHAENGPESIICNGGPTGELEVTFATAVAHSANNRERASLRIELANGANAGARATYAIELVDDHGNAVVPPVRGTTVNIAANARIDAATFETPADLADGFYMARATVVAAGGVTASEIRHLYFESRGGKLNEIEMEDYLTRSDANQGVPL